MIATGKARLENPFQSNNSFDRVYPRAVQVKSQRHWTPLEVARCAAEFLAPEANAHVLDIGSGVGKFCLVAAHFHPQAVFYGVEQRQDLVDHAFAASHLLGITNVSFLHGNFTQLDFGQFDHFYFFNSFYENLQGTEKIDQRIEHSFSLYNYYSRYLLKRLEQRPDGTRLATYHSLEDEVPPCYYVVKTAFDGLLKFWVKV